MTEKGLEKSIERELILDDTINSPEHVKVQIEGKVISLRGMVNTWTDKVNAHKKVQMLAPDYIIHNDIYLEAPSQSKNTLAQEIEEKFSDDPELRGMVGVREANHGRVVLAGLVPSIEAHRKAVKIAGSFPGVTEVISKMDLTEETEKGTLMELIMEKITEDRQVHEENIVISEDEGEIVLGGWVPDDKQRKKAIELAESVPGARHVIDKIETQPLKSGPYSILEKRVVKALEKAEKLNMIDIRVSVMNAQVFLDGGVDSAEQIVLASRIAGQVDGVSSVTNNLSVVTRSKPSDDRIQNKGIGKK